MVCRTHLNENDYWKSRHDGLKFGESWSGRLVFFRKMYPSGYSCMVGAQKSLHSLHRKYVEYRFETLAKHQERRVRC